MLLGAVIAGLLIVALPGNALAVPPPPPNPSDAQLQQANDQVNQRVGQVGTLINQVASANQELQNLIGQVQLKREAANKALVDLQNARSFADRAADAVLSARQRVADATAAIAQAQKQFDEFASAGYQQGSTVGSLTAFLGADGPDEILSRAQFLQVITKAHEAAMEGLERAQIEEANKESASRAAKIAAETAAQTAQQKESAAQGAISTAVGAQQAQAAQKAQIETQRNDAQQALDTARQNVTGLQDQRQVYEQWDQQRQAEEAAAAAAAAAAKQAAIAAAARAAADSAAAARAAQIAKDQGSHTDLDGTSTDTSGTDDNSGENSSGDDGSGDTSDDGSGDASATSNLTSAQAIEIVIDRGLSQLGVRYSWGGGNAKGPTLGIRDGGVADSYGDYKNIGFDCSGLMVYAFAGAGVSLPHYSGYQYTAGKQVPVKQMKRGDMLFWGTNGSEHVTLYLGDGQMLEAPESGEVVKVSPVRWSGIDPYAVRMFP
ncbi:C40 family peptidase [Rhodococcus sp. D2-41]|uniref:NlpC/P60 family protein n=1 Tax=Speluncibacter jeojiensis TaxID=2710754 RepID=UPI002410457B|nr:NlpC/P60 family protein [Rhodococcus sp. D2-41]MDG3011199.1 C40 family peptidase [Rhodococcus sp. D2-41]